MFNNNDTDRKGVIEVLADTSAVEKTKPGADRPVI
jgi:hypothetical protein